MEKQKKVLYFLATNEQEQEIKKLIDDVRQVGQGKFLRGDVVREILLLAKTDDQFITKVRHALAGM